MNLVAERKVWLYAILLQSGGVSLSHWRYGIWYWYGTDRELCKALDAFKAAMVNVSRSIDSLEVLSMNEWS